MNFMTFQAAVQMILSRFYCLLSDAPSIDYKHIFYGEHINFIYTFPGKTTPQLIVDEPRSCESCDCTSATLLIIKSPEVHSHISCGAKITISKGTCGMRIKIDKDLRLSWDKLTALLHYLFTHSFSFSLFIYSFIY